jgi:quercetin dioxygenase-like cupin family protein
MIAERAPHLQDFVNALKAAFDASGGASPQALAFRTHLFHALARSSAAGTSTPVQLPVCQHISKACAVAQNSMHASSFAAIAPSLVWKRRSSGGPHASPNWPDNHANAVIIGQGGLEERDDVAIGASLMSPHVRYPDHDHPPEELYMVLTQGRFQHGDDPWVDISSGGTFHNPPGIKHAMASGDMPLLAIWTMINR